MRTDSRPRPAVVVLLATIAMLVLAQPALAVSWGPNSTYYDGTKRATGRGSFYNSGNTYAKNLITVADDRNDGNTVYGRTYFSFYYYLCDNSGCSTTYHSAGSSTTPEFSNDTRTYSHTKTLHESGSRARAKTYACAQMGWPVPDSCANAAYPSFGY